MSAVILTPADSRIVLLRSAAGYRIVRPSGYVLPVAGASTLGGVKVGSGLSVAGDGTLSATGGVWGSITGTLSSQSDLNAALAARALTSGTLAQFAATTSAELAGVLTDETGSGGGFVRATGPTLTGTVTISGPGGGGRALVLAGGFSSTSTTDPILRLTTPAAANAGGTVVLDLVSANNPVGTTYSLTQSGAVGCTGLQVSSATTLTGNLAVTTTPSAFRLASNIALAWSSDANAGLSADTALARNAAGVVEINNGTAGTLRDLTLRNLTASGTVTVQQSGGAPGTDDATHVHNGSAYTITNRDAGGLSHIRLALAGGEFIEVTRSSGLTVAPIGTTRYLLQDDTMRLASGVSFGWTAFTVPTSGFNDTRLSRNTAGVVQIGTTANNALGSLLLTNLTASGLIGLGTYTVATLPSASANAGRLAQVTDSNSTTNGGIVAGGGSNRVPVFSNGTNWIIK